MSSLGHGVQDAFWMFYETFWALVLGFTLSGIIQALVSRKTMLKALGDRSAKNLGKSMFFGAISSSCSYAASALAHSLNKKGANFTNSIVFMFASTNLVIDLGLVILRIMGWQFAVAEIFGGIFISILLWLALPLLVKEKTLTKVTLATDEVLEETQGTLGDAAGFTIGDFRMMQVELVAGFLVAGLVSRLVPTHMWNDLFIHGHGVWSELEGALIGPIIACISFVCSVGNIPLAASLWHNGISMSGTIAFIYADLLSLPLILIYRKYFRKQLTLRLVATLWVAISVGGFLIGEAFSLLSLTPTKRTTFLTHDHFTWNTTAVLNLVALILLLAVVLLYRANKGQSAEFAIDPVCGMQVRISDAPAHARVDGVDYYFCMEGCKQKFLEDSHR